MCERTPSTGGPRSLPALKDAYLETCLKARSRLYERFAVDGHVGSTPFCPGNGRVTATDCGCTIPEEYFSPPNRSETSQMLSSLRLRATASARLETTSFL
jgi:hypothetical protein